LKFYRRCAAVEFPRWLADDTTPSGVMPHVFERASHLVKIEISMAVVAVIGGTMIALASVSEALVTCDVDAASPTSGALTALTVASVSESLVTRDVAAAFPSAGTSIALAMAAAARTLVGRNVGVRIWI
jgi:hypothetical protein